MQVTREYVESLGLSDSSGLRGMLRYEITKGVRIVFHACVGGWGEPKIWTGDGTCDSIPLRSEQQLRCLLEGLDRLDRAALK